MNYTDYETLQPGDMCLFTTSDGRKGLVEITAIDVEDEKVFFQMLNSDPVYHRRTSSTHYIKCFIKII
jgi:hypothetical protein